MKIIVTVFQTNSIYAGIKKQKSFARILENKKIQNAKQYDLCFSTAILFSSSWD
jgi:hypothetical protein